MNEISLETRVAQKERLYGLLKVKKGYEKAGAPILDALLDAIGDAEAVMEPEDVAYIEKHIAEQK